jgi:hypothetical protein
MHDHHLCYTTKLRKRTQNQPEENSKNRVSQVFLQNISVQQGKKEKRKL